MKREMKDSGVKWIGEIPKEWLISKIKYHCTMQSGDNLTSNDIESEGEYAVYGANGFRGYYHRYNCEGTHILIGRQGALAGNVHMVEGKYWATDHAVVTKITDGTKDKFLYYSLISANLNQYAFATAAQPGLAVSTIINKSLPLPPLHEQQAIANFLDVKCGELDGLLADLDAEIKTLAEYKKSIIAETVTRGLNPHAPMKQTGIPWAEEIPAHWKIAQLKRFVSINSGKEISNEIERESPNAIAVFGSGGIFKYTDQYLYNGEAVLFGRKGTIGKPIYVKGKFWAVDTMYFLKHDERSILPKFDYYMLTVFDWRPYTTNTALPSIVANEIVRNSFPIPPLSEQQAIASHLDAKCATIDQAIADKQVQVETLQSYKASLIYEYVTGKKRVI